MQISITPWVGFLIIGTFVVLAVMMAWGLLILLKLGKEVRGTADNRHVTLHTECAKKDDTDQQHRDLEEKIEHVFSKIGGVERGAQAKVDDIRKEMNQRIDSLNAAIGCIPSRVIADLRNAGALRK